MLQLQYSNPNWESVITSAEFNLSIEDEILAQRAVSTIDEWFIRASIYLDITSPLVSQLSKLILTIYLESMGPEEYELPTAEQELLPPLKEKYDFMISGKSLSIPPGVFRVSIQIRALDEKGKPTPLIAFADVGLISIYPGE